MLDSRIQLRERRNLLGFTFKFLIVPVMAGILPVIKVNITEDPHDLKLRIEHMRCGSGMLDEMLVGN